MNDDELLGFLRHTLALPTFSPPPTGFAALHRALTEEGVSSPPSRRLRRRWVVPAVTTVIVLGGATGAVAATGLPEPLRDAAQLVRLPVSDPHRPSMSELVNKLRADRARGDKRAVDQDAHDLETLLRRGAGNATDRAEANTALEEDSSQLPQPGAPATGPGNSEAPETAPPIAPSPPGAAPESGATVTQPSSPTSTTEVTDPTPPTSQPPSAPTSELSGPEPTT